MKPKILFQIGGFFILIWVANNMFRSSLYPKTYSNNEYIRYDEIPLGLTDRNGENYAYKYRQRIAFMSDDTTYQIDSTHQWPYLESLTVNFSQLKDSIVIRNPHLVDLTMRDYVYRTRRMDTLPDLIAQTISIKTPYLTHLEIWDVGDRYQHTIYMDTTMRFLATIDVEFSRKHRFEMRADFLEGLSNLQTFRYTFDRYKMGESVQGDTNFVQQIIENAPALVVMEITADVQNIPASIAQLSNLKRLVLMGNDLTTLPASIQELKQLEELDLRYNDISEEEQKKIRSWFPKTTKIYF